MQDDRRSALFERYRSRGDVEALAELFDDLAPALLKLARHLDRRKSEAEDLVQMTFLAAIERASSYDAERPLVPWLMGILMNQARAAKRRRRELLDEGAFDPVDPRHPASGPEEGELDEALTRALEQLPEAYRQVLVAHLREGKAPRVIARELGRRSGTVRAQIHRGLRLLRRSLPAGLALGFWALLQPRSLAAVRAQVLDAASRQAGTGAPARRTSPSVALAGVLVALAIVIGAWSWNVPEPAPEGALALHAGPAIAEDAGAWLQEEEGPLPPAARVRVQPAQPGTVAPESGPFGRVLVQVVGAVSARPQADVVVTLLPFGDERWFDHARELPTDADGRVTFDHVPVGLIGVHAQHDAQTRADVTRGGVTEIELPTNEALEVAGHVLDERRAPVVGARIDVYRPDGTPATHAGALSQADGSFTLSGVDQQAAIGARAAGCAPGARIVFAAPTLPFEERGTLVLRLAHSTRKLGGRVLAAEGQPVRAARIRVETPRADHVLWCSDGGLRLDAPPQEALSDELGAFELGELPAGVLDVTIEAPGWARWSTRLAEGTQTLSAQLTAGALVRGVLAGASGSPVPDGCVSVDRGEFVVCADAHGAYELRLPAGAHELEARQGRYGLPVSTRIVLAAGDERPWNVTLAPARTIQGRVLDESGEPLARALVRCFPERAELAETPLGLSRPGGALDDVMLACSDASGRFTLPCAVSGAHVVEARRRTQWRGPPAGRAEHVLPGTTGLRLELGARNAWFTGRLVDAHEAGLTQGQLFAFSPGMSGAAQVELRGEDGAFRLGPVPEGQYCLRLFQRGRTPILLGSFAVQARQTRELGPLRVQADAAIEVRGEGPYALRALDGLWLALERDGQRAGVWRAEGLAEGPYRLQRGGQDLGRELELEGGETLRVRDDARR